MYILFQIEKENDKIIEVKPLFPNEDNYYHSTSLNTIQDCLKNVVDKLNTDKNRQIYFSSLYAGSYKFNDVTNSHTFAILVRMKNELPDKILRVADYYDLIDCQDLLNEENKDDSISYKMFKVKGKLE